MAFCTKCGTEIEAFEKFCSGCGYPAPKPDEEDCIDRLIDEEPSSHAGRGTRLLRDTLRPVVRYKFKLKYLLILIGVIVISLALYLSFENRPNKTGNSTDNLNNMGLAAIQGNWIYYYADNSLNKMDAKSGHSQKIADGFYNGINVVGDWIYGCNLYDLTSYKIKTDGSIVNKFENTIIGPVIGKDVYSMKMDINNPSSSALYRNTEKLPFTEGLIQVTDKSLYNAEAAMNSDSGKVRFKVYESNKDGSNKRIIFDEEKAPFSNSFHMDDEYIYYIDSEAANSAGVNIAAGSLIKYDIKNKTKTKIFEKGITSFNITEDWIYYGLNGQGLYKMHVDGGSPIRLTKDFNTQGSINVVGDWIFYVCSNTILKVKTDGTNQQELGTLIPDSFFK